MASPPTLGTSRPPTAEPPRLAPGQFLAGKYVLVREIGSGGMGVVWHAERPDWGGAPVALKVLRSPGTPGALERFSREVVIAAQLRGEHVVQILDHGIDEALRMPFIAMHLLNGESLARRLSYLTTITPGELLLVMTHVGRAVSRAHELGIIHRDLKPGNIFLVDNDGDIVVKVLDFGLAKAIEGEFLESRPVTMHGNPVGTPGYMSPEQLRGDADRFSDLWSLATIAYECLVGERPFRSGSITPRPVPPLGENVPQGFAAWFARATEPDIERRYQTADELVAALCRLCASGPQHIPPLKCIRPAADLGLASTLAPVTRPPVARSFFTRHAILLLSAGVGLVLGGLGLNAYFLVRQTPPPAVKPAATNHLLPPELSTAPGLASGPPAPAPPIVAQPAPEPPQATSPASEASPGKPLPASLETTADVQSAKPQTSLATRRPRSGLARKKLPARSPEATPAPDLTDETTDVLDRDF